MPAVPKKVTGSSLVSSPWCDMVSIRTVAPDLMRSGGGTRAEKYPQMTVSGREPNVTSGLICGDAGCADADDTSAARPAAIQPITPKPPPCIDIGSPSRRAFAPSQAVEMRDHLIEMHHVGVFVMQVEQVHLVAQHRAVVGALLHHDAMEGVGIGIDRAGAHAARGAFAADDEAVDAEHAQVRDQRRAEEHRGALLVDHQIARCGREIGRASCREKWRAR